MGKSFHAAAPRRTRDRCQQNGAKSGFRHGPRYVLFHGADSANRLVALELTRDGANCAGLSQRVTSSSRDQIQFLLGHVSIQTKERSAARRSFRSAVNERALALIQMGPLIPIPGQRVSRPLATREDLFPRTPFRASVRIAAHPGVMTNGSASNSLYERRIRVGTL